MGLHSGKFGVINGHSTVRNWTVEDAQDSKTYVASNTKFGTGRRASVESWSGSFGIYGHTPQVMPGDDFSFIGFTAPDSDVLGGSGMRYSGTARVAQVQVNWGWQGGEILNAQVNFNGHLALTAAVGAAISDLTVPRVPSVIGTRIDYSLNDVDWVEWTNLVTAQLTLSCALQSFVNSSTVVGGRLWTGQKPGPVDWTLAVTEQDNRRSLFEKGDVISLRLYVNDTEYYELKWAHVQNFTGLTVDVETGAIMQQTVNLGMDGFDPDETTYDPDSIGHVILPDLTQWWPSTGTGS